MAVPVLRYLMAVIVGGAITYAAVAGRVGFLDADVRRLSVSVAACEQSLGHLGERVGGIHVVVGKPSVGRDFACGGEDSAPADAVMVGSRDGTGCGVVNHNFYSTLQVVVPEP
jgi:hypothetical protein